MLKKAKWVKPSHAHEPISRVAADVIRERLEMVWEYAPLAAKKWEDDAEFVHQMRVGTRRSAAALKLFVELLPHKKARHMHKQLKRLRKASGEARDLDVLSERLRREIQAGRSDLKPALATLHELRRRAQTPLIEAVDRLGERNLPSKIEALTKRIRWRHEEPEPSYAAASRQLLRAEVSNFFLVAQDDLDDAYKLHALRIAGKQLRYAMEMLAGAFDNTFRQVHYANMREIQDKLGAINDHATAQARYSEWAATAVHDVANQFLVLAAEEAQESSQERAKFLDWWTGDRSHQLEEKLRKAVDE